MPKHEITKVRRRKLEIRMTKSINHETTMTKTQKCDNENGISFRVLSSYVRVFVIVVLLLCVFIFLSLYDGIFVICVFVIAHSLLLHHRTFTFAFSSSYLRLRYSSSALTLFCLHVIINNTFTVFCSIFT